MRNFLIQHEVIKAKDKYASTYTEKQKYVLKSRVTF